MDYHSIHGVGVNNFSSSSPHRMPTVSAAQALQDLKSSSTRCISTGLGLLDSALQNREPALTEGLFGDDGLSGGVSRGKVTEVYGPPGVGKTALGMQLAASALYAGEIVMWVDASHPLSGTRLSQIVTSFQSLNASSQLGTTSLLDLISNFNHFSTPTLAHLLALLISPSPSHPPPKTSLLIIDSFSTLIATTFPRTANNPASRKPGVPPPPNPNARKFPILQHLTNALQKLAATRNIAVVVMNQCITKMRPGLGAALVPAIGVPAWEAGLGCRVMLCRDWGWDEADEEDTGARVKRKDDVRLAMVLKAEGVLINDRVTARRLVAFSICKSGLDPLTLPTPSTQHNLHLPLPHPTDSEHPGYPPISSPTLPPLPHHTADSAPASNNLKRKFTEIPDSEDEDDEDYGWAEEDEGELPPPPPQWQGSEDILVAPPVESDPIAPGEIDERDIDLGANDQEDNIGGQAERARRDVVDDSEDELA